MKDKGLKNERVIEKRLAERFALTNVHVQFVSRSGKKDQLLQIDFSGIGVRMTVAGLRRLCDNVSAEVGGTLYGTLDGCGGRRKGGRNVQGPIRSER